MRRLWICFILPLLGCSAPVLFWSDTTKNTGPILVYISPLTDQTNQYLNDFQLNTQMEKSILSEFKGIWQNSSESNMRPRFKRIPNPYVITSSPDSSDISIDVSIEQLYFGSMNKSVMASYAVFGFLGAAVTSVDNRKVMGLISARITFTRTADNDTLLIKYLNGKSNKDFPENLSRISALKEACRDVSSQAIGILSLASDSNEANRYYHRHGKVSIKRP
jgi:hypothetical protein